MTIQELIARKNILEKSLKVNITLAPQLLPGEYKLQEVKRVFEALTITTSKPESANPDTMRYAIPDKRPKNNILASFRQLQKECQVFKLSTSILVLPKYASQIGYHDLRIPDIMLSLIVLPSS